MLKKGEHSRIAFLGEIDDGRGRRFDLNNSLMLTILLRNNRTDTSPSFSTLLNMLLWFPLTSNCQGKSIQKSFSRSREKNSADTAASEFINISN